MKRIGLLLVLFITLLVAGKNDAQNLVCNAQTTYALDESCAGELFPEQILAGINFDNCVVELDRVLPAGDGPWSTPVLGLADVGKIYQVRVRHVPSGNLCWGWVEIRDLRPPVLECDSLSTIYLADDLPLIVGIDELNISASDACGQINVSSGIITVDCESPGVQVIQIGASDEWGNFATCQHTVVVNKAGNCQACLSACPEPVTVSYAEGSETLLPAFQANDWSVFDVYGNAAFSAGCTQLDSAYTVTYQPGAGAFNWFVRRWQWTESSGDVIRCEQPVLFPNTHQITLQGKVFIDTNADCTANPGESGEDFYPVVVTKLPSGTTQVFYPEPDGAYLKTIQLGLSDASAQVRLDLPSGINSVCPSAFDIPNSTTASTYTFDFGLRSQGDCAVMQVDIAAFSSVRCRTNTYAVQYCNVGLDTAFNAHVVLHLDSLISIVTATLPYTPGPAANTYDFQVGNVPPFTCGNFQVSAFTDCAVVAGQTLCNEVTAFPQTPCEGPEERVLISTTATCQNDSVHLSVWNVGQLDMTAPLGYIVVEDFIMYQGENFMLNAGDSITIRVPANGATWRIEAEQSPDYPQARFSVAAVEGCGGLNQTGLINAFAQFDNELYYDLECTEATAAIDPNDKSAVPTGLAAEHIIRANESIEYRIRFQNTGTASALQVVVVDSLSALLDPSSLETGASSHPYRLDIYPGGILHFVFDPIVLPDSNSNEPASHGFLQYRIAQKPDLPEGTVIENTAAIYFDDNDPVFTNTTFHTIGYPFMTLSSWTPHMPGVQISLTPNPFREQAVLEVSGKKLVRGQVMLYDAQGRLLSVQEMNDNRAVLQRGTLPTGVYFFRITEKGADVAGGKIQVD